MDTAHVTVQVCSVRGKIQTDYNATKDPAQRQSKRVLTAFSTLQWMVEGKFIIPLMNVNTFCKLNCRLYSAPSMNIKIATPVDKTVPLAAKDNRVGSRVNGLG